MPRSLLILRVILLHERWTELELWNCKICQPKMARFEITLSQVSLHLWDFLNRMFIKCCYFHFISKPEHKHSSIKRSKLQIKQEECFNCGIIATVKSNFKFPCNYLSFVQQNIAFLCLKNIPRGYIQSPSPVYSVKSVAIKCSPTYGSTHFMTPTLQPAEQGEKSCRNQCGWNWISFSRISRAADVLMRRAVVTMRARARAVRRDLFS